MQRSLCQCLNLGLTPFLVLCTFSIFTHILSSVINLNLMCFEFYKSGLCSLEGCFGEKFAEVPSNSDKTVATAASTLISLLGARLVAPTSSSSSLLHHGRSDKHFKGGLHPSPLKWSQLKRIGYSTVRPAANALNWSLPEWTNEISDLISQRCSCITRLFARMNSSRKAYRTLWLVLFNKYINQRKAINLHWQGKVVLYSPKVWLEF